MFLRLLLQHYVRNITKIVSEYDEEIPQSQTADNPWHREEEPHNNHETPGKQALYLPHRDDCKTVLYMYAFISVSM